MYLMSVTANDVGSVGTASRVDGGRSFLAEVKQRLGSQYVTSCAPPYRNSSVGASCPIPMPHLPY